MADRSSEHEFTPPVGASSRDSSTDLDLAPRRRTRVKTGCVTCRIRRIKCDEGRPSCKRCTSTGRKCDGYPALPTSRRDLPMAVQNKKSLLLSCHQVTGVGGFSDGTEVLYFDFFRSKTGPATNRFLGSTFWEQLVLQLSHSEPAIKHAVLAISALHQQWDLYGSSSYEVDRNAIHQYNKAIGHAKRLLTKTKSGSTASKGDIEKVLVACCLFISFENLVGDYGASSLHLANGLQILAKDGRELSRRGGGQALQVEIVDLLHRLDFQAMTFAQTRFPMRIASVRFQGGRPPPPTPTFGSMAEARTCLFEQINWALAVGEVMSMSMVGIPQHPVKDAATMFVEASAERQTCLDNLEAIWSRLEDMIDRENALRRTDGRATAAYGYIRVYYKMAHLLTAVGLSGYETSWDPHVADFEELVAILEVLERDSASVPPRGPGTPLSLEVGICVPLWLISYKCRDPAVRRRAIAVLDAGQRKEGIWESAAAARVAERMMQIEERAARTLRARRASPPLAASGSTPAREAEAEAERERTGFSPSSHAPLSPAAADIKIECAADVPEEARIQLCWTDVSMAERRVRMTCSLRKGWDDSTWRTVEEVVEF